jgi:hypothetical protein
MSRIFALRTVRGSPTTSSISSSTCDLEMELSTGLTFGETYGCNQPSANGIAREQFPNDSRSSAGRNDYFGCSSLKRFNGGFQLGAHAAGGDSRLDKLPALIRI